MKPKRYFGRVPEDVRHELRSQACAVKEVFHERSAAQAARDSMGKRGRQCRVYPCPYCGHYHLASADRGDRARRRRR